MTRESANKLIVILGPTASGKSALGVNLARLFNGEVISADSRQVYKGLNIGSGKITKKEMQGVKHYLLDVTNPSRKFSVAQYQKLAMAAVKNVHQRSKLALLVGGSGFYIQSIVDGITIPEVKANWKLREKLSRLKVQELFEILKKLDLERAKTIDAKNPVRLIRAIEINLGTGKPVPKLSREALAKWDVLQIGIKKAPEELKKLIAKRLQKRQKGMIAEVKKLHNNGLSWKRLEELGLEYRFVAQYLQGKISQQEMMETLQKESWQYAKRQMTWFKRDKSIHWITTKNQAQSLVRKFLT